MTSHRRSGSADVEIIKQAGGRDEERVRAPTVVIRSEAIAVNHHHLLQILALGDGEESQIRRPDEDVAQPSAADELEDSKVGADGDHLVHDVIPDADGVEVDRGEVGERRRAPVEVVAGEVDPAEREGAEEGAEVVEVEGDLVPRRSGAEVDVEVLDGAGRGAEEEAPDLPRVVRADRVADDDGEDGDVRRGRGRRRLEARDGREDGGADGVVEREDGQYPLLHVRREHLEVVVVLFRRRIRRLAAAAAAAFVAVKPPLHSPAGAGARAGADLHGRLSRGISTSAGLISPLHHLDFSRKRTNRNELRGFLLELDAHLSRPLQ
uniref:Uncharacterized protein n=1 Tax=Leersia perrieri TaxID=77586 RepID=A0A0D9UYX3_9ORYZ